MKEAEKYLKSRNIIKEGFSEFWITFEGVEKIELTEVLQSYADHYLKKKLQEFDWEKLREMFPYHPDNDIKYDYANEMRNEGAKAILKELGKS